MEPQDNKKLALQKAISSHEQAAAALTDLITDPGDPKYAAMLERIERNMTDLHAEANSTDPGDLV